MSTRSIIVVTGPGRYGNSGATIRIYKHCDGYPTANLPLIADALAAANKNLEDHNVQWKSFGSGEKGLNAEHVTGKIIGEAADVYGMGARIDNDGEDDGVYNEFLKKEHLGNQWDLEWIYVVDLGKKNVAVYAGHPETVKLGRTTDPLTYVKKLREECQENGSKEIKAAIEAIEKQGFTVNGKTARKKAAPKAAKKAKTKSAGTGKKKKVTATSKAEDTASA